MKKLQPLKAIPLQSAYQPEYVSSKLLPLTDDAGNQLALYGQDWFKLKQHFKTSHGKDITTSMPTPDELRIAIDACDAKVVRYFSDDNLASLKLDTLRSLTSAHGEIVDNSGYPLCKTNQHQNCFALINGHFYIHPKIRAKGNKDGNGLIGVNHTSLTRAQIVQAAGSFVYHPNHGWLIENSSGHYQTQIKQIPHILRALRNQGINLEHLTVRTWVPICDNPSPDECDYDIRFENAAHLLARTNQSKKASSRLLNQQARNTRKNLHRLSTNHMDYSQYIFFALEVICQYMSSQSEIELRSSINLQYFLSNYDSCVRLIITAAAKHTPTNVQKILITAVEQASSDPQRAYSRRYYDHCYSLHLKDVINGSHHSSLDRFAHVIAAASPKHLTACQGNCKDYNSIVEIFKASRTVGDESADILRDQDDLRSKSPLYAEKDRGPKKTVICCSAHCSVFTAHQPLPRDLVEDNPEIETNRIADAFTIKGETDVRHGFSRNHANTPFVNSVSGSMYTLMIWLQRFINHYEQTISHDCIQRDINNIITTFCVVALQQGYHSMHELLVVLDQPEVIELFKTRGYDISAQVVFNHDLATNAMRNTLKYSDQLRAKIEAETEFRAKIHKYTPN